MFDIEGMLHDARMVLREYISLRAELDELQARPNDASAKPCSSTKCCTNYPNTNAPTATAPRGPPA